MAKELDILYPEGAKLIIGGKDFSIKPLVFGQRTKLLRTVTKITAELAKKYPNIGAGNLKVEDMIEPFCEIAGDRMKAVYSILLGVDEKWIEDNLDLPSEVALISLFVEQNNLPFLVRQVKGMSSMIKDQMNLAKS